MFRRTVELGKVAYSNPKRKANAVTLELELQIENRPYRHWETLEPVANPVCVSVCGSIWNSPRTDIVAGGQYISEIAKLLRTRRVRRIETLWKEWHLNTMQSGLRVQREALDAHILTMDENGRNWFNRDYYRHCCDYLRSVGLYEVDGYQYGHGWIVKPLPVGVEIELRELFTGDGAFQTSPEWVAALEAEPDNPALRCGYADWLMEQGQRQLSNDQRIIARGMGLDVVVDWALVTY